MQTQQPFAKLIMLNDQKNIIRFFDRENQNVISDHRGIVGVFSQFAMGLNENRFIPLVPTGYFTTNNQPIWERDVISIQYGDGPGHDFIVFFSHQKNAWCAQSVAHGLNSMDPLYVVLNGRQKNVEVIGTYFSDIPPIQNTI